MTASTTKRLLLILTICGSQLMLAGCGSWWLPRAHKIDIQQGNVLPDDAIADVTEGLSRSEVIGLLGSPVANNRNNPNRWDYIYSRNKAGDKPDAKRLTLYFDSDRIVRIEKDGFDTVDK